MAENESEWPAQSQGAQYPRDNWQAAPAESAPADDGPPTAAQVPPTTPYVPPATPYGVPAAPYVPPAAPQVPPVPYVPPVAPYGYQVPPGGYQVPPGGYPVPPGGYQVPAGGHQMQARMNPAMNPAMRAASADRERAVDVLKAGFTEGRLTQDEYNERMNRAYAARTYAELTALTADLPAGAMPMVYPMPVYQPPVSTNSLARASLVLGVAEFFTMGLTAIPAIICGHMAKREMRQTGQRGDGLATSGLVLGYMAVIFWGILIVLSIVGAVISATGTGTGG
ncbi:MAG TPA: DUF1707 and DUF4190 domain-containing protein [Streptosporangiaceae bacterium]